MAVLVWCWWLTLYSANQAWAVFMVPPPIAPPRAPGWEARGQCSRSHRATPELAPRRGPPGRVPPRRPALHQLHHRPLRRRHAAAVPAPAPTAAVSGGDLFDTVFAK